MTHTRTLGPAAGLALAVVAGLGWPRAPAEPVPPRTTTVVPAPVGLAGCAAAACHGAPPSRFGADGHPERWRCSAAQWSAADPHRHAYAVLDGELAEHIMARYAGGRPATAEPRCLACHTNPSLAGDTTPAPFIALRAEGVSCEACHGGAGGWVGPHTTWRTAADREVGYDRHGMAKLFDLGVRAEVCLGCHVGAPGDPVRDMNHDMIAAGHPRLEFDFADALARLPKHWDEKDRTTDGQPPREAGWGVRAWLVGRVAHAEAAGRLTADRAARADPWPELAEGNCFACHHTLPEGWRQRPGHAAGRPPGSTPWQTIWPVTGGGNGWPAESAELIREMESRRRPRPERVAVLARTAADRLKAVREELTRRPLPAVAEEAARAFTNVPPADRLDWDTACQVVHGLRAFERSRPEPRPDPGFASIAGKLALTRPAPGGRWDGPRDYDPAAVRQALDSLLKAGPRK
jgi:hypothetical protein